MKNITLLGASGSIGTQCLNIIKKNPQLFNLIAISVNTNIDYVLQILPLYKSITHICVNDQQAYQEILKKLPPSYKVLCGEEGLIEIATLSQVDYVINALVGFAGLKPTLEAINHKKNIGLANKETLVSAGHLITKEARYNKVKIYPIDSEHSAIFQCLKGEKASNVEKLILTASGGAFRDLNREQLESVDLRSALQHPNWNMGPKITIDSATMVNKGLEIIEAHWLFNMPYRKIEAIIHPQSIIHSMVQFSDGSIKAQLASPDMRIPIQYALSYPSRLNLDDCIRLDFEQIRKLDFQKIDLKRYPAIVMAYRAGKKGGSMPAVYNAANEIAVQAFMEQRIKFSLIEQIIDETMKNHQVVKNPSLEEVIESDGWARQYALSLIKKGQN